MKKLIQHSSHYLAVCSAVWQSVFISFPIFTRIFSVADYGMIDLSRRSCWCPRPCPRLGCKTPCCGSITKRNSRRIASPPGVTSRHALRRGRHGSSCHTDFPGSLVKFLLRHLIGRPLASLLCFRIRRVSFCGAIESFCCLSLRIEELQRRTTLRSVLMKAATGRNGLRIPAVARTVRPYISTGTMAAELVFVLVLVLWLFRRRLLSAHQFGPRAVPQWRWDSACRLSFYELAGVILLTADRALVRYYLGAEAWVTIRSHMACPQYVNDLMTVAPRSGNLGQIYLRLWDLGGPRQNHGNSCNICARILSDGGAGIYMLS